MSDVYINKDRYFLANIYLFKVNRRNTRKRGEISSKLIIKNQSDVIGVVLMFLLLMLNIFHIFFQCFLF